MSMSKRLQEWRQGQSLTINQAADKLNCTSSRYNAWENAKQPIDADGLREFCRAGGDLRWLLLGDPTPDLTLTLQYLSNHCRELESKLQKIQGNSLPVLQKNYQTISKTIISCNF